MLTLPSNGRVLTAAGIAEACDTLGVKEPLVWAMLSAEPKGLGFVRDRRPRIQFEREIFHRLTCGRFSGVQPGLSNSLPGGYVGPAYEFLRLEAACGLDADAAIMSASWGLGQLMGSNHESAGFRAPMDFAVAMHRHEDAQLHIMSAFVMATGLVYALRAQDWDAFARGYMGTAYLTNGYAVRLASAYQLASGVLPNIRVRTVQAALYYLGYRIGPITGFVGPRLRAAVLAFQRQRNMALDGQLTGIVTDTLFAEAWP